MGKWLASTEANDGLSYQLCSRRTRTWRHCSDSADGAWNIVEYRKLPWTLSATGRESNILFTVIGRKDGVWLSQWSRKTAEYRLCCHLVSNADSFQIMALSLKKYPAFYGTKKFIPVFTKARDRSLSWARWISSQPPIFSLIAFSSLVFPSTLGLPTDPVPGF
jgi:hypothetical protein